MDPIPNILEIIVNADRDLKARFPHLVVTWGVLLTFDFEAYNASILEAENDSTKLKFDTAEGKDSIEREGRECSEERERVREWAKREGAGCSEERERLKERVKREGAQCSEVYAKQAQMLFNSLIDSNLTVMSLTDLEGYQSFTRQAFGHHFPSFLSRFKKADFQSNFHCCYEEFVFLGDERIKKVNLNQDSRYKVFKKSLPGATIDKLADLTEQLIKLSVITTATKYLFLMPFLYDFMDGIEHSSLDTLIKDVHEKIQAKNKEWKSKFVGLRICWIFPYALDFR